MAPVAPGVGVTPARHRGVRPRGRTATTHRGAANPVRQPVTVAIRAVGRPSADVSACCGIVRWSGNDRAGREPERTPAGAGRWLAFASSETGLARASGSFVPRLLSSDPPRLSRVKRFLSPREKIQAVTEIFGRSASSPPDPGHPQAEQSAFRRFSRSSTLTFSINCTFQSHSSGALARGIVTREVGDGGRRRVRGSAGQARARRRGWRLLRRGARRNPRSGCPDPGAHRLVVTVRKFAHTRTKPLRRPSRPSFPVPDEPRSVPLDARRTRTPDTSTRGRSGPGTGSSPSSAADLSARCAKRSIDAPGASSR